MNQLAAFTEPKANFPLCYGCGCSLSNEEHRSCRNDIGVKALPEDFEQYLRNCLPPFEVNRNLQRLQQVGFAHYKSPIGIVTINVSVSFSAVRYFESPTEMIMSADRIVKITNERWSNWYYRNDILSFGHICKPGMRYRNLLLLDDYDRWCFNNLFKPVFVTQKTLFK